VSLDEQDIERIAVRVVELLRGENAPSHQRGQRLVDAAQLAVILGVERDWVYAHARQLGAVRLGGPRGRLRFDVNAIQRQLAQPPHPRPMCRNARGPWQNGQHHLDSRPSTRWPGGAPTPPARHREA
jgi:hypothetical protein